MKRLVDILVSILALILTIPLLLVCSLMVWAYDRRNPLYFAERVGRDGNLFVMVKIRSMIWDADKNQVDSTTASDSRIIPIGKIIRRFKIDELPQFWNVLKGDMSLVGPRPNVQRETRLYTDVEKTMLSVRPGITDISSIVFSDLAQILEPHVDANLAYNQLVRPWKSRLSIICIKNTSLLTQLQIISITTVSLFSRKLALKLISNMLRNWAADETLRKVALRDDILIAHPPPGADQIVQNRGQS